MSKIINEKDVLKLFKEHEVALITGSFDVLHLGHLRFFSKTKSILKPSVKILTVILSDEEIKRRKGLNRPIFSQDERAEALSYVRTIDYVYKWKSSWEELRDFVLQMKPKYLAVVKGDSGIENKKSIIERAGGELIVIEKIDNFSSSNIIEKLGL
ncbi:MAG TPA: adenylyltransferase/cytidyltransferase family protein [Candidatus Dojkabacteria bacterium]|nr:adenylyltransferase/cytidyltransferase family protein [Candidatus Dojkabacteria bacterium]HRO65018.1 adenylyltransferase/cytidyltransferase family protein [Candidatus Dojkabacteria bacterium]HRP36472.1 adenylyltransferase/cytidyltransferase family protein [Candidatus Dojkabacteria bacterium]HRP51200.1 adenylyltransferase/cytidyltransferase family protein [Candidatus Dojkabacteria bacterium]